MRGMMAGGLIAVAAAGVAQDVPVASDAPPPEIVVTGTLPRVEAGMWPIRRWPTRSVFYAVGAPGPGRTISLAPGWDTRRCIPNGGASDAIGRLLSDGDRAIGCSRLGLQMIRGRLSGKKSCTRMAMSGVIETTTRYRGTLAPTRIDVRIEGRQTKNGADFSESAARLEADRTGDCRAAASVAGARQDAPPPAPENTTLPGLDLPAARHALPADAQPAGVAVPTPVQPRTTATESADDIVVVARRLRRLRLTYSSSGRILRSCRTSISSGDRRVDRIGCAIVRACVREGFGDRGPDIACFRRKVNSLEPD